MPAAEGRRRRKRRRRREEEEGGRRGREEREGREGGRTGGRDRQVTSTCTYHNLVISLYMGCMNYSGDSNQTSMTGPQGFICEHLLLLAGCVKVSSVFVVTFFLLYIILCTYCVLVVL